MLIIKHFITIEYSVNSTFVVKIIMMINFIKFSFYSTAAVSAIVAIIILELIMDLPKNLKFFKVVFRLIELYWLVAIFS